MLAHCLYKWHAEFECVISFWVVTFVYDIQLIYIYIYIFAHGNEMFVLSGLKFKFLFMWTFVVLMLAGMDGLGLGLILHHKALGKWVTVVFVLIENYLFCQECFLFINVFVSALVSDLPVIGSDLHCFLNFFATLCILSLCFEIH